MSKRVLLVDDSVTIQKVAKICLAEQGVTLDVASNGEQALNLARSSRPDLVVIDGKLGKEDGLALGKTLSSEASLSQVPKLLLYSTHGGVDEAAAEDAGFQQWCGKPFDFQSFVDKVEETLASAPAFAPAAETVDTAPPVAVDEIAPIEEAAPVEETSAEEEFDLGTMFEPETEEEPEAAVEEPAAAIPLAAEPEIGFAEPEPEIEPVAPAVVAEQEDAPRFDAPLEEPSVEEDPALTADELDLGDLPETEPQVSEPAAADPMWEGVEFGQEDLAAEPEPVAAETEEAFTFTSEPEVPVAVQEEAVEEVAVAPTFEADDLSFEPSAEEEILELTEDDILAVEPLAVTEPEPAPEPVQEATFEMPEPVAPVAAATNEPVTFANGFDGGADLETAATVDTGFEAVVEAPVEVPTAEEEPLAVFEEPVAAEEPVEQEEVRFDEPLLVDTEKEASEESAVTAAISTGDLEAQLKALPEGDLRALLEKVARPMLEEIAWEVVPDLAEGLIREEIRKIKESAA